MLTNQDTRPDTIICDIDGVIFKHEGTHSRIVRHPKDLLPGVREQFDTWERAGCFILLVTGCKESYRAQREQELRDAGLFWDVLVMGMGGGRRVLVNDLKPGSARPTAVAVNLNRDEGLEDFPDQLEACRNPATMAAPLLELPVFRPAGLPTLASQAQRIEANQEVTVIGAGQVASEPKPEPVEPASNISPVGPPTPPAVPLVKPISTTLLAVGPQAPWEQPRLRMPAPEELIPMPLPEARVDETPGSSIPVEPAQPRKPVPIHGGSAAGKFAVVLWGQPRFYREARDAMEAPLYQDRDVDVYCHFWHDEGDLAINVDGYEQWVQRDGWYYGCENKPRAPVDPDALKNVPEALKPVAWRGEPQVRFDLTKCRDDCTQPDAACRDAPELAKVQHLQPRLFDESCRPALLRLGTSVPVDRRDALRSLHETSSGTGNLRPGTDHDLCRGAGTDWGSLLCRGTPGDPPDGFAALPLHAGPDERWTRGI